MPDVSTKESAAAFAESEYHRLRPQFTNSEAAVRQAMDSVRIKIRDLYNQNIPGDTIRDITEYAQIRLTEVSTPDILEDQRKHLVGSSMVTFHARYLELPHVIAAREAIDELRRREHTADADRAQVALNLLVVQAMTWATNMDTARHIALAALGL